MSRSAVAIVCGSMLLLSNWAAPAASANGPFLPPVETPIQQAVARVSENTLTAVLVVMEHVLETREEAYPVKVKVARSVNDPATQEPKVVFEEQTEMRTRTVTVTRPVYKQVLLNYDVDNVEAVDLAGAKVDAEALKTRLSKQALVLTSPLGTALPEQFAILFKPETIVLDLSRSMPMASAPALAPPLAAGPAEVFAAPLPADVDVPKDADIPPQFRLASIDADGQFVLKAVATHAMASTRQLVKQETRVVEGKEITVNVCVPISVTERRESTHSVSYPATAVSGVTVDEKALDDRHRAALKSREIPVVVAANGRGAHAFWLQNIKPNMLVLTVPAAEAPLPPGEAAVPMPPEAAFAPPTTLPAPMPLPLAPRK